MLPREFVNYQDKLYWVYKKMASSKIKEGYTNDLKEFWRCDVVVRNPNDNVLLFLKEIPEAQVIS